MNCIQHIQRTIIPSEVIVQTAKLYYEMGRGEAFDRQLKADFAPLLLDHAHKEAVYFYKCFFYKKGSIPESRMKSLTLSSTISRNKNETLFKNIVHIFETIFQPNATPFELNVVETTALLKLLYQDVFSNDVLTFQKVERTKHSLLSTEIASKRELLQELIEKTTKVRKLNEYESLYITSNFLIDFYNMNLYKIEDILPMTILLTYVLALQQGVIAFRYMSFFQKLQLYMPELISSLVKTKVQWSQGFADTFAFHSLLMKLFHSLYEDLAVYARDHEYESTLEISKSDYIENTIDKLPEVFSKEDIRQKHPLISDSTINRTFSRLQANNLIRPLGKGRSAKWMKLYVKPGKKATQIGFDLGE
ncbi:MAG: hypothetical protein Q8M70_08135 [bacterium]|nr:hypothetical protein [bacterium]